MNRLVLKLYTILTGLLMMQENLSFIFMLGWTRPREITDKKMGQIVEIDWFFTVMIIFFINLYDLVAKYNNLMHSTLPTSFFFLMNNKTTVHVCDRDSMMFSSSHPIINGLFNHLQVWWKTLIFEFCIKRPPRVKQKMWLLLFALHEWVQ